METRLDIVTILTKAQRNDRDTHDYERPNGTTGYLSVLSVLHRFLSTPPNPPPLAVRSFATSLDKSVFFHTDQQG